MVVALRKLIFFTLSSFLIVNFFLPLPVQAQQQPPTCRLSCIGTSFQQIFPFDIFSGIPSGQELECPSFTIFERDFEFCLIVDAISAIKFPLIAALLIKIYLFS